MIKLSIATLFFGRPDISAKFLAMLKATLRDRRDVELLFLDNGCIDYEKTAQLVFSSGLKNLTFITLGKNLGFAAGNNLLLEYAKGTYFLALNNDLYFSDSKWVDKLLHGLENNPELKLVGLEGAPCSLVSQSNGHIGGARGTRLDYIEGSCVVGRTGEFKKYGLFDPIYRKGLFEDGDLSMRYRQVGFKISVVKIAHQHLRAQSMNQLSNDERKKNTDRNCETFKKRWSGYMSNRQFVNRIEIEIESLGIGDVLARTPLVEAIRKVHPSAIIEVTTTHPEVFESNPHLSEIHTMKRDRLHTYDRAIKTKPNYASYRLIAEESAEICGVELEDYRPQVYLSRLEVDEAKNVIDSLREDENDVVVGVHLQNNRPDWEGKCYPKHHTVDLIERLQNTGARVVELGKDIESSGIADMDLVGKLKLRELFSIVASLDLLVCVDSLVSHVARAFGISQFTLYGATHPLAYILSWSNEFPIFRDDLVCVGCYQEKNKNDLNKCCLNYQECMEGLLPEKVMEFVMMPREQLLTRNIKLLEQYRKEGL